MEIREYLQGAKNLISCANLLRGGGFDRQVSIHLNLALVEFVFPESMMLHGGLRKRWKFAGRLRKR